MRLPRSVSGQDLAKALRRLDYTIARQTGSHMRLTTQQCGEHHITIPNHDPLRVGTLSGIIAALARHHRLDRDEVMALLFPRQ